MKREQDNPGDDISNPDPNSAENLNYLEYSIEDENFHIDIATFASLAQAQDPIIEPMEIADLVPPIKDELPTSPRQESGFGDLKSPQAIQGERAKVLYEYFDAELADALMESKKGFQNINQEPRVPDKSDVGNKGKGRAERPSIDLSLIGTQTTYGNQSSLYQNLLSQETRYNPNIHGSSSRDILGSLPYSHLDPSELKLTDDEKELIDNGILSYDEILQQRIQISQFEGQGIFQSQPQSQGLFSERTNPFAQNSGEGESVAKCGPATGIDHEFIEKQGGLGSLSEGFSAGGEGFKLPQKHSISRELIEEIEKQVKEEMMSRSVEISREIDESFEYFENSPPSLLGSEENDHESDLNETEIELLDSGVSIEDILGLRERMAQERIQPLSAESLDSNSSQKSPSRE